MSFLFQNNQLLNNAEETMFGLGEAEKLKKLKLSLRGRHLHEVISDVAEPKYTQLPKVKFDLALCNEMVNYAKINENMNQEEKISRLNDTITALKLQPEALELYFAWTKYQAVKSAAETLFVTSVTCDFSKEQWVDYFFNYFIREVGLENIFFFAFPQQSGGRYEDHKISAENRDAILEFFFAHIQSRVKFVTMVNHFAAMNPHFRDYPI